MLKVKHFRQTAGLCGPASLKMVMNYYGVFISEKAIARAAGATRKKGTSIGGLIVAAKKFGFEAFAKKNSSFEDLEGFVKRKIPVIVDWFLEDEGHYSVVVDINKRNILLMDPSLDSGRREMARKKFLRLWFDFPAGLIKTPADLILRLVIVVTWKTNGRH